MEAPPGDDAPRLREAEVATTAAVVATPNESLKPGLRIPGGDAASYAATQDSTAVSVHLGLRWCKVEPTQGAYDWSFFDTRYRGFLDNAGVEIRSIRVVDAPAWAITTDCLALAQRDPPRIDFCPPKAPADPALADFGEALARHYGPGTEFDVERTAFWNEPNFAKNWGVFTSTGGWGTGDAGAQARKVGARRYSERMAAFSYGVEIGDGSGQDVMKVDAGEIAAGSAEGEQNANGVGPWVDEFTRYSHANNRDRWYDVLVIHAYSEYGRQIPKKVYNHKLLPGVTAVGVGEFAWGAGSRPDNYRCVGSEGNQMSRFRGAMTEVRQASVGIHHLVYFSVLDNERQAPAVCPDAQGPTNPGGYYTGSNKDNMNTFGLYRRPSDGSLVNFGPAADFRRPVGDEFRATMR